MTPEKSTPSFDYFETVESCMELKLHPADIARRLGMHLNAVRRILPKDYSHKVRESIPYGMTNKSYAFRLFLADILITMGDRGYNRTQIANITGLNKHESYRAERNPFTHDWTISQIERTLLWKGHYAANRRTHT